MNSQFPRRSFLKAAAGTGAAVGLGQLGFLSHLPSVSADEAQISTAFVKFRPEIEPLVRLLEDTPRGKLLEEVGARIKAGTTYREILAALQLAGVRNIQPRPVGFKFHAVLVINSAHLASQNSPDQDRWLPIFWALDQFKSAQARDTQEGNWTMSALDEGAIPEPAKVRSTFIDAMENWDEAKADVAVAGLARSAGAQDAFDLFCRFGARDFRDIGHKAIYVANSWRTLQNIGWRHAEPVLRSLAYALLEHEGDNPSERDGDADRAGRKNLERLREIRADWQGGKSNADGANEMLLALRSGSSDDTAGKAVELLNRGIAAQSIWDALFQAASEMLMRKPGIVSLHACTSTNALHFAHNQTFNDETRRYLLLQNAAFIPLFRDRAGARDGMAIDQLEPLEPKENSLEDIFADVSSDKMSAARKTLGYLSSSREPKSFIDAAQRMIYLKGTDSHDYKFSSAVLEDYFNLSPEVRNRFLAASVFWLKGSGANDSPLVARTRAAI
jgi:TAT (twin-arginine translocation) pathway signal sequence